MSESHLKSPNQTKGGHSSDDVSSYISSEDTEEVCHLKKTPSSLIPDKSDHPSLDESFRHKFRVNCKQKHVFNFFKITLLVFNGLLILLILGGVVIYFSEFQENAIKFTAPEQDNILGDGTPGSGSSSGPKFSWVGVTLIFAMLLAIPCTGFFGALKEHVCLLVLYGVIFFVEAIVFLIFKSFWFLFPALLTICAIGLVFLIKTTKDGKDSRKTLSWCLSKV